MRIDPVWRVAGRGARRACLAVALVGMAGCDRPGASPVAQGKDTVVVAVAASLTNALRPQLDSFSRATGITVLTESGGSMEHVRKVTDLQRVPDLMLLADDEVFSKYLYPQHVGWWADFARNRMVVAYTDRSKGFDSINESNWPSILTTPGVQVGRADPRLAPVGYRTLTLFALSELFYRSPGLAGRLAASAPPSNVRANAAELAALLAAGELDYIYEYESVAKAQGFRYIVMPVQVTGRPITFALSIPRAAAHPGPANRLLEYLASAGVRASLRAAHVDMLERFDTHGSGAPAYLTPSPP